MKKWYVSKTLWVNVIGVAVIVAQGQFGYEISPEMSVSILAVINFALRLVTKTPVSW